MNKQMDVVMIQEIIASLEELKPWQRFAVPHVDELIAYLKGQLVELSHRGLEELVSEAQALGFYEANRKDDT